MMMMLVPNKDEPKSTWKAYKDNKNGNDNQGRNHDGKKIQ